MRNEEKLKDLIIAGTKELGEIAECIIKDDKTNHWIDELSDLSALCIKPMLELAGISFENACEMGIRRKRKKLQELDAKLFKFTPKVTCPNCQSVIEFIKFTPDSVIHKCSECGMEIESEL